jgi:CMP-N-acetylneuraminic acid synthetase
MKIIAMIPARLGSKRIPKKNLRLLHGKPLLQYAIDLANACDALTEVWVNSESDELGRLALKNGARFHKRPPHLSTDTATNQDFTAEFLQAHECDFVVMVNSTSPLATIDSLNGFCEKVRSDEYDTVMSVIDEYAECFYDGRPVNFPLDKKINSQDLSPVRKVT